MSEHFPDAQPLEVAQASTVVARIEIQLLTNGAVAVRGQITDERFALQMIDTARDTLRRAYARQRRRRRWRKRWSWREVAACKSSSSGAERPASAQVCARRSK